MKRMDVVDVFESCEVYKWWEMLANPYECGDTNYTDSLLQILQQYLGLNQIKGNLSPLALELCHDKHATFKAVTKQISKRPTIE